MFKEFSPQLTTLEEMTSSLMEGIEEKLGGKARSARRSSSAGARDSKKASSKAGTAKRKSKARPAPDKLYSFETRIAGIEPPIRRLLIVPGNRTLTELHGILQDAFGWSDSHLHCFKIRGENYGEPSPDDFEPLIDERKVRLDELSLRVRSRIEYVYDYGDDWEHELVVVSARKAGPGADLAPSCLAAERSAPPEDCGGLPGYEELLEAFDKPEEELDEDEAERLEWLGDDWDPEGCDLGAINRALEKD